MWHAIYHGLLSRAKAQGGAAASKSSLQLTVETDRLLIIRRLPARGWCRECGYEVDVVSSEHVDSVSRMSGRASLNGTQPERRALLVGINEMLRRLFPP